MFKKAGLSILVVMMIAFTAGISSASNTLLYGGSEAANSFVTDAATSFSSTSGVAIVGGALAGAATAGSIPTDLYINPADLGDVLIYPYYNVNSNVANLFNIVNTADYGVRARIRFFEGKCSTELLDFDVCLSRHDVWTAAITNVNGLATVVGLDTDTPIDYGDQRGKSNGVLKTLFPSGVGMRTGMGFYANQGCTGTIAASDTLEGYFAVIGLNRLDESTTAGSSGNLWVTTPSRLCGLKGINTTYLNDNGPLPAVASNVENVLMGYSSLINTSTGRTFEYNATAVGNFNPAIWTTNPVDERPNLADFTSTTLEGKDLDFALTKRMLYTSYYRLSGTTGTEMIINYPTRKHTYTADVTTDDKFDDKRVAVTIFNDQESTVVGGCTFSPCPGGSDVSLPNEVNILSFNTNTIFTSALRQTVSTTYTMGYIALDLTTANTSTISPAHLTRATNGGFVFTTVGLPAIALQVVDMGAGWNWMAPMAFTTNVTRVP